MLFRSWWRRWSEKREKGSGRTGVSCFIEFSAIPTAGEESTKPWERGEGREERGEGLTSSFSSVVGSNFRRAWVREASTSIGENKEKGERERSVIIVGCLGGGEGVL